MAGKTKPSKKSPKAKTNADDEQTLRSDIANFTSSLFSSSGFNDSDFRKKGPLKPQIGKKQPISDKPNGKGFNLDQKSLQFKKNENPNANPIPKPKSRPSVLSTDESANGFNQKGYDKFKNLPKLPLVKASALGAWYVDLEELEKKVIGEGSGKRVELKDLNEWKAFVEKKRELGERLMFQYAKDYESSRGQSGDIKMLAATQRSGTAADKVSAFSVMVGDNPVANLRSLDGLLGLVTSKVGKRHALTGFEVLKELFVSSLLPDRKLKNLLQRPLRGVPETKDGYSLLLFWYFEECLKQRYERFIFALEEASRDMLPVLKDKALKTIYALLKSKSEQERRLLSALVNKLGDPQNKGASNADFHLSNLLSEHPNMKAVVIDEVDSFLFRPHLGLRAKYHAVNFLSQIRLSNKGDGPNVAKRLIDVYFALFKVLITEAGGGDKEKNKNGKKDLKRGSESKDMVEVVALDSHVELDSRILSVLLTGVNRAFPYVSSNAADDIVEVQTPLLFQLVHSKNFNIGVQALMLLDKISSKNQVVSDRFYRALYSKLLLPAAMNSSKTEMFIGLLLRAMKNDVNLKRVAAFSKRLLQVALQQPPQYACGYLFLLSEVLRARPPLWNMVLQNESIDDELEHFEDVVEETENEAPTVPKEQQDNVEPARSDDSDSDSDSASVDKDESPDTDSEDEVSDEADELLLPNASNDVQHPEITNDSKQQPKATPIGSLFPAGYNPRHREPSYCNADRASWWELTVLASHCHPSVAAMARTLLSGANIVYNGNPLNDLALTAFLDKFMEKKPKQNAWHGGSQIEPAKKLDMNNHFIGPEILSLAETDVPPEDVVFHKFYMNKMNSTKKQKKKKKKKGAEDEAAEELFDVDDGEKYDDEVDGGDESDNEEIENMLDAGDVSSDGEGEYDYDDLDNVANEDDDDLVGNTSDVEGDLPFDIEDDDIDINDAGGDESGDDDDIAVGDADDASDDEDGFRQKKGKRKSRVKKGESPFASLEEYEHLINEADGPGSNSKGSTQKKSKSRKKRKPSK